MEILSNQAGLQREVTCYTCNSCLKPGKEGRLHKLHQNKWQDGAGCFGHQDAFLGRGASACLQVVLGDSLWKGLSTWSQCMAGRLQWRVSKAGQEDGEQEQPRRLSDREMTALLQKVCFRGFTLRKVYLSVQCTTITAAAVTKGTAPGLGQGFHSGLAVTYWWGWSLRVWFSR